MMRPRPRVAAWGISRGRALAPALLALGVLTPAAASAEASGATAAAASSGSGSGSPVESPSYRKHEKPLSAGGPYVHFMGALALGEGLRFNNPYRLSKVLGKSPESLSLTAPYLDFSAAALLGHPDGLQHGLAVHLSTAVQGIAQEVLAPSYIALVRLPPRFAVYGRAGLPVVLEPDATLGLELAAGGAWMASAGLGVTAELVGSVYYGAATEQTPVTTIPVLSLQIGAVVDYEVLP